MVRYEVFLLGSQESIPNWVTLHLCQKRCKLGFYRNLFLKTVLSRFFVLNPDFSGVLPPKPRAVSFKLSTADFELINLTEDSLVYLSLIKRVSHNN